MKRKNKLHGVMEIDNLGFKFFTYFLLILGALVVYVPLYIIVSMSFKGLDESMNSSVFALPQSFFNFENFQFLLTESSLLTGFKNVIILVLTSLVGSLVMGSMVAYILGRFKFKLKKLLLPLFMFPIVVPAITTQVATFTVVKSLGLFNTIFAGIVLYIATDIMQIYIFLQHIEKIPYSLDESARIDGASYLRIYWSIIVPQLKPAIATALILKTITIYNDFFTPYLYMPKSELRTVTTAILAYVTAQTANWGYVCAGIVIVMIPTVIMYIFMQKYIIAGVTDGAIKT